MKRLRLLSEQKQRSNSVNKETQSIDAEMEEQAFEPTASELDDNGNPLSPVLDLDAILATEPKYEWQDIEYRGTKMAIQVLKGNIIHFMGTLDDADILIMEEVYAQSEEESEDATTREIVEKAKPVKFHNDFVLKTFIKGVNEDNVDELPEDLKTQMLKAYDKVNGISVTNKAVQSFPDEGSE